MGAPEVDANHYLPVALQSNANANEAAMAGKDVSPTLKASDPVAVALRRGLQVRRLTPMECERLQGFPDNFTQIPYRGKLAENCPDGPRYKSLGNSMAVPVMRWIGERINEVDQI
jgi:DNA (cytosine-5)-methyltransferase 1